MEENQKLMHWVIKVSVGVLASVMVAVVLVLLVGIFMPNDQIDNKDILAVINPAFNTIIGAFVGLLGGLSINKGGKSEEKPTELPPIPTPDPVHDEVAPIAVANADDHEDHIA